MGKMKFAVSFLVTVLGWFCIIAAIVSLSTAISHVVSFNANNNFHLGANIDLISSNKQILFSLLYAVEISVGVFLIRWGKSLYRFP